MKYNAKYKPNQLIYGQGLNTVIVCGWTPREIVARSFSPLQYAAVGNLYSPTRGLSFLIRHLLLNPQIHNLLILSKTKEDLNSGACEALRDFFEKGVSHGFTENKLEAWIVNSQINSYVDIEISYEALEVLRQNVNYYYFDNLLALKDKLIELYANDSRLPWGNPREFSFKEKINNILPGPLTLHRIEAETVAEAWCKIIHRIRTIGKIRPNTHDGYWQELISLSAVIHNEPIDFYFPEPNYLPISRDFLDNYIVNILSGEKPESVEYTYGIRLRCWKQRDQVIDVVNKLSENPNSASAVMSLWDVETDHQLKSPPCLNHIWFRVVENVLYMSALFRSNDMYSAWPANAMGLRALQVYVCNQINEKANTNFELGSLIITSLSAHIYDECWEEADKIIEIYKKQQQKTVFNDPVGNFLIEIKDDFILVTQTTPGSGEEINCFSGKNPLKLVREICVSSPSINPIHAAYLGIELQKAYLCLINNLPYQQDK